MFPYHPLRVPSVIGNPTYFPSFLLRHTVFTSPIDLSIRTLTPITPPSTPSPIRTRVNAVEFMSKHSTINATNVVANNNNKAAPILWKWNELGASYTSQNDDDSCTANKLQPVIEANHTTNGNIINDHRTTDKCDYDLSIKEDYESDEDAFVDVLTQDDADVS